MINDLVTRCDKKMGRSSTCGQIATVKIFQKDVKDKVHTKCRCAIHSSGIKHNNELKISLEAITHEWPKIHAILQPLIGKTIYSKWHRKDLIVKYIKYETMLLMCQDSNYRKWYAVYAKEITEIK